MASRTLDALGMETAGFVDMIQSALICPLSTALNISIAFKPGAVGKVGADQKS